MKEKALGRTGRRVSVIGLGTAFLGRRADQAASLRAGEFAIDHDLGVQAVLRSLDAGVTLLDTAILYGTEAMVGDGIRQSRVHREGLTLMTKVGRLSENEYDYSYDGTLRQVHASLDRLQVEHLDVVSIHDAIEVGLGEVMSGAHRALQRLRDEGLVGAIGTACWRPDLNADYLETGEFDVGICAGSYSLINLTLEDRILPAARTHDIGLIIAEPLERGLLATGPAPGRSYADRDFAPEVLTRVQQIQAVAEGHGVRLLDVALQWLVREETVSAAIPGAATADEAVANAAVADLAIPQELWDDLAPLITPWSSRQLGLASTQ